MTETHNNYGFTKEDIKYMGRWTPVYTSNKNGIQSYNSNDLITPSYGTNHSSINIPASKDRRPVNYILSSDSLPTVSKRRHHSKRKVQPEQQYHRHFRDIPLHRRTVSQISTTEGPPVPREDYSLSNDFRQNSEKPRNREYEKKGVFRKYGKKLFQSILLCAFIAYFITVLMIKSAIEEADYWCNADGLLIILTVLGTYIFVYYKILTPIFKVLTKMVTKEDNERVEVLPKRSCINHWIFKFIGYGIFFAVVIGFLIYDTANERRRLNSLAGIFVLLFFGIIFSSARTKIKWENIIWAFGFQFAFGLLVLRWPPGISFFECISGKVQSYLLYTDAGSSFIYGNNLIDQGIFAFKAMSVVIFFSLCIQVLYYYGIMQFLVMKIGWLLKIAVGTTACESVSAAGNMFLGQTEAPLLVKPYLPIMTQSELHAVMTGGFATISGSVMAAFISFGVSASHLVTASVMNAPAALGMSKIYSPEIENPKAASKYFKIIKGDQVNVLHAALDGVSMAIPLVANICANLLAFIAFIAFADGIFNWMCLLINVEDGVCTLSNGFGYIFMPLAFVMGVPWIECYKVGQLIGTKVFVNEFVAYVRLTEFIDKSMLSKRAEVIVTYALCGFGNISSIGIQIGGLGSLAPTRKPDFAKLAISSLLAGCSASFMTACIAGTLISSPYESTTDLRNITIGNDTLQIL